MRTALNDLISPESTALLVVDVQNDFCHGEGIFAKKHGELRLVDDMLPRLIELVDTARRAGVLVVWVTQRTEPHGLSDSPAWLRYKTRDEKSPEYTLTGSWGEKILDSLVPVDSDPKVVKYRSDSFHKTSLDMILRANERQTVLVTGVNTEGCVDATLKSASFHDYYAVLVDDCVGSFNVAHHDAILSIIRTRHDVVQSTTLSSWWSVDGDQ